MQQVAQTKWVIVYLDKLDPSKITKFEQAFLQHLRGQHKDVLESVRSKNEITPET
ncbi:unnamed protein product, partial [Rotaria sp. Silwood2]